jgi:hypothetical protein
MDCRYCEIQVEITKRAHAARCPNPVAVLEYIREKMNRSTRPRVDIADMKRSPAPPALEENMPVNNQTNVSDTESDLLTTAAKAIGTTLGKIAVSTGIAKAPAPASKVRKKAPSKKKTAAKPAGATKKKTASKKTASGKSPKKSTPHAKTAKAAKRTRVK